MNRRSPSQNPDRLSHRGARLPIGIAGRRGDSYAAQKLWERYLDRLVRLARRKLGGAPRRAADEEDVAIAAFANFYRGVEAGRFSKLDDRDDLWQLLIVLTERNAIDQIRREFGRTTL